MQGGGGGDTIRTGIASGLAQSLNCNSMFCHFRYTVRRYLSGQHLLRGGSLAGKVSDCGHWLRKCRPMATPAALCDKTEYKINGWIISYLSCQRTPRRRRLNKAADRPWWLVALIYTREIVKNLTRWTCNTRCPFCVATGQLWLRKGVGLGVLLIERLRDGLSVV